MSETTPDQEQQQPPQQGQPRHYQGKQNGNRSQFHKSGNNIQGSRPQPQKHYQTQRSYQGKGHNKNARSQRTDYGSLQNIPPYMQYYPSPVANGFPNPGPGGFYSYSPTPYYPPATMGYEGSIQPTIMNPKYKVGQENSESSAASSATTTPAAKKIEITNKSGDHVDLNAIHLAQHATEATPSTTAGGAVATFTEGSISLGEEKKTDENTKKAQLDFLAEVKRRKEMLAKKKAVDDNEDAVSEDTLDTQTKESVVSAPSQDVSIEYSSEIPPSAVDSTDDIGASTPTPLATAEKTESTPAQEGLSLSQADVDEVEEVSTNSIEQASTNSAEAEDIVDVSQDTVESTEDTQKDSKLEVEAQNGHAAAEPTEPEQVLTYTEKLKLKKAKDLGETPVPESPIEESAADESEAPADISLSNIVETVSDAPETTEVPEEEKQVKVEDELVAAGTTENQTTVIGGSQPENEEIEEVDDGRMTMSELLTKLESLPAVEDIYTFCYPDTVESPSDRFKKNTIKYTYPPEFLLQFGDKVNVKMDAKWKDTVFTKIVIPPGSGKSKSKGGDRFSGSNFKKSGSMRMGDRSNSKSMSKRSKSKRMGDDGKSNRSYTSRKEREAKQEAEAEKQKEEIAPLVPSANRWVPKSKMKKTEKKLAPDGVTELLEKEEAERKMKSLLNKLTLEKFDTISEEIISIANQSKWEENGETLKVVIEQIFHKATDEPHWSSMYAQLCGKVVKDLDKNIKDKDNEGKVGPILVLHYLFDRCQTEFQKGWADKLPIGEDGTTIEIELMSDEYYKAAAAKRRGLGLVRLIGFLYRSNLLTSKMMFQCFRRLMKDLTGNPSEETLESVIELLNTVGEQFERDSLTTPNGSTLEGSALLDQLFVMLDQVIDDSEIPSRIKFSLLDLKDMRTASWNGGSKDEGPKTIAQIHEEEAAKKAAEERERRMKGSSRSTSRRQNNSMGGRSSSRRDVPPASKDDFITMRSASSRFSQQQKQQKEEAPTPQASSNMFSALMGHDDEDDDEEDDD